MDFGQAIPERAKLIFDYFLIAFLGGINPCGWFGGFRGRWCRPARRKAEQANENERLPTEQRRVPHPTDHNGVLIKLGNLFVAPRAPRPLISSRMFRPRLSPFAALAGLLIIFSSCERHHLGELPELQREQLHPVTSEAGETHPAEQAAHVSPTPANFFPNQQP
jgi:hypothetical protein